MEFIDSQPWILAPLIFLARIGDVSLGTFRLLVVFRGYRLIAAAIGFIEVMVWVLAARQVISHLDSWNLAVAYAGGFAVGNYIGIWIESRVGMGNELVRVISHRSDTLLSEKLKQAGFSPFVLQGSAAGGSDVQVMLVTEQRRKVPTLLALIDEADPQAMYTISDVKAVHPPSAGVLLARPIFNAGWRVRGKRK